MNATTTIATPSQPAPADAARANLAELALNNLNTAALYLARAASRGGR